MKCIKCVEQGLKSKLYNLGSSITLMGWSPYFDEEGIYHNHNPNTRTTTYECSNGHYFNVAGHDKCPNCDYGRVPELVDGAVSKTVGMNLS